MSFEDMQIDQILVAAKIVTTLDEARKAVNDGLVYVNCQLVSSPDIWMVKGKHSISFHNKTYNVEV